MGGLVEVAFHRTGGNRRMVSQGRQESEHSEGCSRLVFPQTLAEKVPCPCPTISKVNLISGHNDELTYTALQRAPVDIIATQLANRHGGVLVCVHLNKSKAAIRLEASLNNVSKILEQGNKVILGGIWRKVANVDGGLPLGSLLHNHIVALDTVGWEMVVAERRSRSKSSRHHGLLLGDRWLALLIRPVTAYRAGSEPLSIH
jgi:hypothetical protein